jgi:hypothetical protein
MGEGGMREGRKPSCRGAISKLESCLASIVNRGTLSTTIGRQFGEEVGQLQVAMLPPEASDAVASGPPAAGAGDALGRERKSESVWEPSRGILSPAAPGYAGCAGLTAFAVFIVAQWFF